MKISVIRKDGKIISFINPIMVELTPFDNYYELRVKPDHAETYEYMITKDSGDFLKVALMNVGVESVVVRMV